LFRATSARRISAFRAFPTQPAVTPLGALCSPAVGLATAARVASGSRRPCRCLSRRTFCVLGREIPHGGVLPPQKKTNDISHINSEASHQVDATSGRGHPWSSMQSHHKGTTRFGKKTGEAGSNRQEPRLQSLTPAERPFPADIVRCLAKPMLSWPFSPPRPTNPIVGLASSPHVLPSRPRFASEETKQNRSAALQGIDPIGPGDDSEDPSQPP
jgi:hypothetical protein